jgi:hypothetical protein
VAGAREVGQEEDSRGGRRLKRWSREETWMWSGDGKVARHCGQFCSRCAQASPAGDFSYSLLRTCAFLLDDASTLGVLASTCVYVYSICEIIGV